jgi:hypothetical protein
MLKEKSVKDIKVQLIYKPSLKANFRISKALEMLINEEDIRNYFQKLSKKNEISKPKNKN